MLQPTSQIGRWCRSSVGRGSNGEATGLDEERGLFDVGEGLLEEGDGGAVEGMMLSKVGQGCLPPFLVGDGRIGTSLKKETDDGCIVLFFDVVAG